MEKRTYSHILLATDFADNFRLVADRALEQSVHYHARLSVIHIVEYQPVAFEGNMVLPEEFNIKERLETEARKTLTKLGDHLGLPTDDLHITPGSATKEILRFAAEQSVDLIVVGSHGRHGLSMLLGSTANSILHHAPCDVLAVRVQQLPV